ncbi:MAG: LysR substrate-binding domain-containing protein [Chloroflexi bacterium]|nr:LysR substrate-binding domain-containing protein [Chloroflexota bacterium]
MLDIHQLNVFLAAAESLNFTQAAQRMHMTQPSVSQHIQALERHFGADLFVRNGRNLELTDSGMALMPLAREAVFLSVHIDETLASLKGDVIGHLKVGCSTTPGKYVLPQLLARFHNLYPKVRVTCQVSSQDQALQMLSLGEVHFALTSLSSEVWSDLEFHRFLCDRVTLIAPLNHPWARQGVIEVDELTHGQFILREETSGTYIAVREALAAVGVSIKDLDTLLTLGNSEAIALAVQEGLGVGFISEMVVQRLGEERVAQVKINGVEITRQINLGRHLRRPATVAQTAFWAFILSKENPIRFQCDGDYPRYEL